jgi:hypothetical protein
MSKLPKFKDLASFTTIDAIDSEIFSFQKRLFELKISFKTKTKNKNANLVNYSKPHLFIFIKRKLTHLKYKRSILLRQKSNK